MKLRQLKRNVRDGFRNTWNHLFMSISSVVTLTITLSLVAGFILFAANTNAFTRGIEGEVRIFVAIEPHATDVEIEEILEYIEAIDEVEELEFNTAEEEAEYVMSSMNRDDDESIAAVLIAASDEVPLSPTVIVGVEDVEYVQDVAAVLNEMDNINYVSFGDESTLNALTTVTHTIRNVMIFIVIVLLVLAVFLIQNTIKLTIFNRQEELKIQKLVGASIGHVTVPFIVEGLIIGILGAAIPILLTMVGYSALFERTGGIMVIQMLSLANPNPLIYQIGFVMGIISIGVSLLGSFFAVSRYALKE